jgi:hypothetical protein
MNRSHSLHLKVGSIKEFAVLSKPAMIQARPPRVFVALLLVSHDNVTMTMNRRVERVTPSAHGTLMGAT